VLLYRFISAADVDLGKMLLQIGQDTEITLLE